VTLHGLRVRSDKLMRPRTAKWVDPRVARCKPGLRFPAEVRPDPIANTLSAPSDRQ
jgi:hypothetical protein